MTAADKILALVGLLGLVIFNSVILIWVAEPDLIIIVSIALMLAAYDFWRSVLRKPGDNIISFAVFLVGLIILSYAMLRLIAIFLLG